MNWTFGIITAGHAPYLRDVITSIGVNGPPLDKFEIILVGGQCHEEGVDIWIPFDETIKKGWLTKKKNLIAEVARNENICFMHDYVALQPGWWEGVQGFGYDWLTCMHRVLNNNNQRHRDWCVIFHEAWMDTPIDDCEIPAGTGRLLNYDNNGCGRWQYYSGTYFCAKRSTVLQVRMNENYVQSGGEDVEWSRRLFQHYGQDVFTMNTQASVKLLKQQVPAPWQAIVPYGPGMRL